MQGTRNIHVERIEKFLSDTYFTDVNLRGKIYPVIDKNACNLKVSEKCDRITFDESQSLKYESCKVGKVFGPSWSSFWFQVSIDVPQSMKGEEVHFLWNSSSEALIWRDGAPIQGLTGGTWVDKRIEYKLFDVAEGGEHVELVIEMACNGMFGVGRDGLINACDPTKTFTLVQCEIGVFDRDAYTLFTYLTMLHDVAKNNTSNTYNPQPTNTNPSMTEFTQRANQALRLANDLINQVDVDDRTTFKPAIERAQKEFFEQANGDGCHGVSAIGHCHIDVAWLWPYAETKRKCARSFATQLLYMDYYRDYKFVQSQAQLYSWTKQLYPQLYARMLVMASKGQWVTTGGTWVEMDGNLPGGESFVRQFLHGQRFFKSEFGQYCTEFWLPDTFGYSGQLPQVVRHAGISNFITQKLSWNNINKFPHSTFIWEGIDGSRVLTHFPPANTYNSAADVKEVQMCESNHKNNDVSNNSLMIYGHGDGGGGPNIEMIERLSRLSDTNGIPQVKLQSPAEFFKVIEKDKDRLPVWIGELYFELHRGTYTTQANCKKGNRKCEQLLHDVEALSTILDLHKVEGFQYPRLKELWELLLLNQFHDVLPGSSIGMVYKDAAEHHGHIQQQVYDIIKKTMAHLVGGNVSGEHQEHSVAGDDDAFDLVVFNPSPFDCEKIIELPDHFESPQKSINGHPLAAIKVPSYGFVRVNQATFSKSMENIAFARVNGDGSVALENPFLQVLVTKEGAISSIVDRRVNRQVIDANEKVLGGIGNRFVLYDDQCLFWDAWDVEIYSQNKYKVLGGAEGGAKIIENGPYRVAIEFSYPQLTSKSSIKQIIYLSNNSPRIDFETVVEWHENRKMLKVEFPTTIRAMNCKYDIQFGHVERPTHKNTTWDVAKFEVCGHKWADLSEYGYGVALLNDCKYGYSVSGGVMRLSLLRSAKSPDDEADMGTHRFTYSLLPHTGDLQQSGVITEGYALNTQFHTVQVPSTPVSLQELPFNLPTLQSFVRVNCAISNSLASTTSPTLPPSPTLLQPPPLLTSSVIIETLKKCEEGDGYIIRVYESFGGKTNYSFNFCPSANISTIVPVNGLEEELKDERSYKPGESIPINPFQIQSFKLV
ncbi:alpha-mannosidase [Cavenderia fasciculata]|uniref:alpha-mannosidase n=1 Tax=Cavenderia fasciculata TaxID=261658 RepID=F4PTP7_CACFS|nr:alpha-mannosidase [Cavenderia fasciculata]EGG21717.1 alpha-mannosidase [Cavenderia fasciculata]|eukprot:XP_004359567.1 alpha-mannosidase [Cavenderia fasciculata]